MNGALGGAQLWWGMLFGSVGAGYCVYAKKQRAWLPLLCSVGLIVAPYLVANAFALVVLCAALMAVPFFIRL